MPQDLLDHADVGAVLQHCRRHRVPQQVTGPPLGDPRGDDVVAGEAREVIRVEGPPRAGEEHGALVGLDDKRGSGLVEVLLEPGDRPLADGDDAILPAFALADGEDAPGEIET